MGLNVIRYQYISTSCALVIPGGSAAYPSNLSVAHTGLASDANIYRPVYEAQLDGDIIFKVAPNHRKLHHLRWANRKLRFLIPQLEHRGAVAKFNLWVTLDESEM